MASQSKREADRQGYAWTAGYLTSSFNITSGLDNLDEVIRNNAKLLLCKSCRGLIYGISLDPDKQAGIGIMLSKHSSFPDKNISASSIALSSKRTSAF